MGGRKTTPRTKAKVKHILAAQYKIGFFSYVREKVGFFPALWSLFFGDSFKRSCWKESVIAIGCGIGSFLCKQYIKSTEYATYLKPVGS